MGDLFLRMRVLRQSTARFEFRMHLVHRRAARDRAALDPRRDFYPRIIGFAHENNIVAESPTFQLAARRSKPRA